MNQENRSVVKLSPIKSITEKEITLKRKHHHRRTNQKEMIIKMHTLRKTMLNI